MKNPVFEESKDGLTPGIADGVAVSHGDQTPSVVPQPARKGVWRFAGPSPVEAGGPVPEPVGKPVDAATVAPYDFTPRPDLLLSAGEANPFTSEVSWLDRVGTRALALGVGIGILAIGLAWTMWSGASDRRSRSVAVLGNEAQVETATKTSPNPGVEALPPVATAPISQPAQAIALPVPAPTPAPTPAPPLATVQPRELKPVEPNNELVVPAKTPAKARRVRKTAAKAPVTAARRSANPAQKPKRAAAKAVAPARLPLKPRDPAPASVRPAPESAQAALLKACRGYGYHAALCVERGCKLTKFGLACTGK